MSTIVVGVDGSADSKEALRFALAEAKLRDAKVVAVQSFEVPPPGWPGLSPLTGVLREEAQRLLNATIDEVTGRRDSGVAIERIVAEDQPAEALVRAARGADLLVVGSRGLGGFAALLLGSVSQQCAQHAPCPVAIVRTPRRPRGGDRPA